MEDASQPSNRNSDSPTIAATGGEVSSSSSRRSNCGRGLVHAASCTHTGGGRGASLDNQSGAVTQQRLSHTNRLLHTEQTHTQEVEIRWFSSITDISEKLSIYDFHFHVF